MLYCFDNIQLDSQSFMLWRNGRAVSVEPQVFDLITFLVQNPDRVLSRDDIMTTVWKGKVVSDTTISSAIKSARQALGDNGEQQKLIRTVRGRGFQFVGTFENNDTSSTAPGFRSLPTTWQPTLLILPLQLLGDSDGVDNVADGLVENLCTVLTRVPLLALLASSTSFAQKNKTLTPSEISKEYGATYLLQGSAQKVDASLRVNVQLIDTSTSKQLWAQQFIASLASDTVQDLLRQILPSLEPQVLRAMARDAERGSDEPSSEQLLLKAIAVLALKGWHKASFIESADLLRQSIDRNPDSALAHSYLALTLALGHRVGLLRGRGIMEEAAREAETGLDLDGMDSDVLGLAACALADIQQTDRALPLLKRAIELNPNNAQAHAALGSAEIISGNLERGINCLQHGIHISPSDGRIAVWGTILALAYLQQGCFDKALAAAEHAEQHDDKNYLPKIAIAASYLGLGQQQKVPAVLKQCLRVNPDLTEREFASLVGREMAAILIGMATK